jgi:hypothetical protein
LQFFETEKIISASSVILNFYVVIDFRKNIEGRETFFEDYPNERIFTGYLNEVVPAVACWLMWAQFLYFIKMSDNLSFYSELLFKTIADLKYFFLIFALLIFPFANAFYILNASRD